MQGHQILNIKQWQRRPWTLRLPNHLFKMKVNLKLTSKVISSILLLLPLLWKITANNWFSHRQIKKSTWIYFIIKIQMSWWMKVIKMRMNKKTPQKFQKNIFLSLLKKELISRRILRLMKILFKKHLETNLRKIIFLK